MLKKIIACSKIPTVPGRQCISLWASRIFEHKQIKNFLGVHLVAAVFVTGIATSDGLTSQAAALSLKTETPNQINAAITTKTTFEMPLTQFTVSQFYSNYHKAVDLAAPIGTPVYAIEDGIIETASYSLFGYGQHVIIAHTNNFKSLYAHLSETAVLTGRKVTRGELIGKVGSTGFATGNHLHLEMYQNNLPLNPLEVLPVKPSEIQLNGILTNIPKTPTPSPTIAVKN